MANATSSLSGTANGFAPAIAFPDINEDLHPLVSVLPLFVTGLLVSVLAFALRLTAVHQVTGMSIDQPKLDDFAAEVRSGFIALVTQQTRYLAVHVGFWSIILFVLFTANRMVDKDYTDGLRSMACFVIGALCSSLAGVLGPLMTADDSLRTTVACAQLSVKQGWRIACMAGAVVGFLVVGFASIGYSGAYLLMSIGRGRERAVQLLCSFGFGASSVSLFHRVVGGIFSQAADMGADLVGKVEIGNLSKQPHNPLAVAISAGEIARDAACSAELFESYVGALLAAGVLGAAIDAQFAALPMWLATAGLLSSFLGFLYVFEGGGDSPSCCHSPQLVWRCSVLANTLLVIATAVICMLLFGTRSEMGWKLFGCTVIGVGTGFGILTSTEYFTSVNFMPSLSVRDRGTAVPELVVIQGLGVSMISSVLPAFGLCAAVLLCAEWAGGYGVALAAVGMLSTSAVFLFAESFHMVVTQGSALSQRACLDPEVKKATDVLDTWRSPSVAPQRGFAVGAAVLVALALVMAYKQEVTRTRIISFRVGDARVLGGAALGAMLPHVSGSLSTIAVAKAAIDMVQDLQRQVVFASTGKGEVQVNIGRCIQVASRRSTRESIAPSVSVVLAPLLVGFFVGPRAVMGLLVGCVGSTAMLAVTTTGFGGAFASVATSCDKLELDAAGQAFVAAEALAGHLQDTCGHTATSLLKTVPMTALLLAPILDGNSDWESWYYGFIPLAVTLLLVALLVWFGVTSWAGSLTSFVIFSEKPKAAEDSQVEDLRKAADSKDVGPSLSAAKPAWS